MFALFAIIALAVVAIVAAFAILGAVLHLFFSPLVIVAAIAIFAWVKFGPRRARR